MQWLTWAIRDEEQSRKILLDVGSAVVITCACLAFRPKSRYLTACDKCSIALLFVPQVVEPSEGGGRGMGAGVLICSLLWEWKWVTQSCSVPRGDRIWRCVVKASVLWHFTTKQPLCGPRSLASVSALHCCLCCVTTWWFRCEGVDILLLWRWVQYKAMYLAKLLLSKLEPLITVFGSDTLFGVTNYVKRVQSLTNKQTWLGLPLQG